MKFTFLTHGRPWDGYVAIDGVPIPYEQVWSFSASGVELSKGPVVSEGVEVFFWEGKEMPIPEEIRAKLKPAYDLGKKLEG